MQSGTSDRIHALPVQLANQIAAGEVVERPASVVKELVENSIDAGATRIAIDIRDGGKTLIRVQDNGYGIHVDDLHLALTRHATSKLRRLEDLHAINSLGFRGEALPSIASVCRFELCSRYRDSDMAWRINVNAQGQVSEPQQDPQPEGTRITVEELFCNTPARRRFLRSARTEFLHIHDIVMRAALSRFDIAFSLRHNSKEVLRLPAIADIAMRHRRLATVGGRGFAQSLQLIDEQRDGVRVSGWLAPAAAHRAQADRQFVFINGRMVRDKVLMHAIRQAYGEHLPPGRYAMYALYIELDPARVDVNVHPTKHEVRFREIRLVHDVIFSAVQQGLQPAGHRVIPDLQAGPVTARQQLTATVRESATVYTLPGRSQQSQSAMQVLGLLPGGYALLQSGSQYWLYDVNQVAGHVFLARIKRQQQDKGIIKRPLLIPQRIELPEHQVEWLDSVHNELSSYGIELTRTGDTTMLLRTMPEAFLQVNEKPFIESLAERQPQEPNMPSLIGCAISNLSDSLSVNAVHNMLAELENDRHSGCRRELTAEDMHAWYHGNEEHD